MTRLLVQFTGAQGCGKSTLAREVRDRLHNKRVGMIGEVSRSLLSAGAVEYVDVEADDRSQMLINAELLYQYYREAVGDADIILAERSPICCLAYARNLTHATSHTLDFTERFLKATLVHIVPKVVTIYVPSVIPFVEDGVRNALSRDGIDTAIRGILSEFDIEHVYLGTASVDERVATVLEVIRAEQC